MKCFVLLISDCWIPLCLSLTVQMMMNEKKEFSRGLSLLSFLIKPVQRLMKYPLLLRVSVD